MGSAKRRNKRSTPSATWMAGNRARSRADAHARDAARGKRDTHLVERTDRREKDDGRRWNRKRSPRVSTGVRVRPQPHTGTENARWGAHRYARAQPTVSTGAGLYRHARPAALVRAREWVHEHGRRLCRVILIASCASWTCAEAVCQAQEAPRTRGNWAEDRKTQKSGWPVVEASSRGKARTEGARACR